MNCLSSSVLKIKYLDTSASVNKLNEIKRTSHKNYTTICTFGDYSLYQIGGKSQFPTFPPAEVWAVWAHCISFSQWEIQCLTELHYRQWDHEFLPAQETLLCTWPWPLTSLLKRGWAKIAFPCVYQYSITWHQGHSEIRETVLQDMYADPFYTATRLSFYFVLIWALTQAPRGLIFFYTTAAFILSDSQQIHWANSDCNHLTQTLSCKWTMFWKK